MQSKKFWKTSLEIYLSGNKKNINYQIKFTLNLPSIYLTHIIQFFILEMKYVVRGNVRSGKFLFGKMSFAELSIGEMSFRGIVRLGNCSSGNSRETKRLA